MTANLALNKQVYAGHYVMPYRPDLAVNGNDAAPTSRWLDNTVPAWMGVDLGFPYYFNRWVVKHMPVGGWLQPNYCISDFKLQGSNHMVHPDFKDKSWTNIDGVEGNTLAVTDRTLPFPVQYRYVRVYVSKGLLINDQLSSFMELEVYEAPPTSPYLVGLNLSSGALNPAFAKNLYNYTDVVDYSVPSITVTPIAEDPGATIKVNGAVTPSGTPSAPINLVVGSPTNVAVEVSSLIGGLKTAYTVAATRSHSVNLSNLTLSAGTLNPAFNKTHYAYTGVVDYSVPGITLTPTAEDSSSAITVNGTAVTSGQPSSPISLNVGVNPVNIMVTAAGGAPQNTYTLTVNRAGSQYLQSLTLAGNVRGNIALTPTFDGKNQFSYTAISDFDGTSVTMTLVKEDSTAAVTVSGSGAAISGSQVTVPLSAVGAYPVTITVTASGGISQSYNITVTKPSSAYLTASISLLTTPPINIPVARNTTDYSRLLTVGSAKIKASLEDGAASMALSYGVILPSPGPVTNVPMTNNSWAPAAAVPLDSGTTTRFVITVTSASGGGAKKYNVDIAKS